MSSVLIRAAREVRTLLQFLLFLATPLVWVLRVVAFAVRHPLASLALGLLARLVIGAVWGTPPTAH